MIGFPGVLYNYSSYDCQSYIIKKNFSFLLLFFFFLCSFVHFSFFGTQTHTETLFDVCLGTNMIGCSAASFGCSMGEGWISCQNKDIRGPLYLNDDMSEVTHLYLHKNYITTLDARMFRHGEKIQMISLSGNQLQMLPVEMFETMSNLRSIKLEPGNEAIRGDQYRCPNENHRRKRMEIGRSLFWACEEAKVDDL